MLQMSKFTVHIEQTRTRRKKHHQSERRGNKIKKSLKWKSVREKSVREIKETKGKSSIEWKIRKLQKLI
jgi:hypothetical protein